MSEGATQWNPELYDEKHAFVYQYGEALVELLQPQQHERILDLGCGTGPLTYQISQRAKEVIGLDQSPDMIAEARSKFPTLSFEVGDAAHFSFREKFDAIFSNATLHWVTDYKGAVRCMYDQLKAGGRMVVEFGGKGNIQAIVTALRASLAERGYKSQSQLQLWYFPSIGEYATELEAVGFRVVMAHHFDRPTPLSDEATGIKDWLTMFGKSFFEGVDQRDIPVIQNEVQDRLISTNFRNGKWYADYKRLRVIAVKE